MALAEPPVVGWGLRLRDTPRWRQRAGGRDGPGGAVGVEGGARGAGERAGAVEACCCVLGHSGGHQLVEDRGAGVAVRGAWWRDLQVLVHEGWQALSRVRPMPG